MGKCTCCAMPVKQKACQRVLTGFQQKLMIFIVELFPHNILFIKFFLKPLYEQYFGNIKGFQFVLFIYFC